MLAVVLSLAGLVLFSFIYALTHGGKGGGEVGLPAIFATIAIFFCLLGIHERLHGVAMSYYGATPAYGAGVYKKLTLYFYCTAPGYRFTRSQFAVIAAAPLMVISLVGGLCAAFVPYGGWLAVPVGLHLGGCVGDVWILGVLARLPRGTELEDLKTGLRTFRPV